MFMSNYNFNTLSFLISSFKNIVYQMGQNSKAVELYKSQVKMMCNIGQVGTAEAEIVEKLVGMSNTNAVKWEQASKNIEEFINAMNILTSVNITDENAVKLIIIQLKQSGNCSNHVNKVLCEIFDLKNSDVKLNTDFGNLGTTHITNENNTMNNKHIVSKQIKFSNKLADKYNKLCKLLNHYYSGMHIRIRNPEAVCSNDPSFYYIAIKNLTNLVNIDNLDRNVIKRQLSYVTEQNIPFDIGDYIKRDVGCHYTYDFKITNRSNVIDKRDFQIIINYIDELDKE